MKEAQRRGLHWRRLWPLALPAVGSVIVAVAAVLSSGLMHRGLSSPLEVAVGPFLLIALTALFALALRGNRLAVLGFLLIALTDQSAYALSYILTSPRSSIQQFIASTQNPPSRSVANAWRIDADTPAILRGERLVNGFAALEPYRLLDYQTESALRLAGVRWRFQARGWTTLDPFPRVWLASSFKGGERGKPQDATGLHPMPLRSERASILQDEPGNIVAETRLTSSRLLVLSERYDNGWEATEDGKPRRVLRVYGDFIGCLAGKGRHRITFSFHPSSFRFGMDCSFLALSAALLYFLGQALSRRAFSAS